MINKQIVVVLLLIFSFSNYAQIKFENGYFINNNGEKTDCLIKNVDWRKTPTEFEYKLSETSEAQVATIRTIQEFAITNGAKFTRFTVDIDKSIDNINNLTHDKNPKFEQEQLFLKTLVEGKATLYLYKGENIIRYFYSVDNSDVQQLVYKRALNSRDEIQKNEYFKQQLWIHVKCGDIALNTVERLRYTESDLSKYFMKYNRCENPDIEYKKEKTERDWFNLSVKAGLSSSSLSIENLTFSHRNTDFGNDSNFRFGIEVEAILPFNKDKWGIFIEPTYQSYEAEQEHTYFQTTTTSRTTNAVATYKSIDVPIGARYYMFINDNAKVFVNAAFVLGFDQGSGVDFEREDIQDLIVLTRSNFAVGAGFKYKNRYSIEFKYDAPSKVIKFINWNSEYSASSLVLGYSIF